MTSRSCALGRRAPPVDEQDVVGLVTTYALIILTVIVFPLTVMLAGTWLLSSAFDVTPPCAAPSASRRRLGHPPRGGAQLALSGFAAAHPR